jgi:hypothetical protein
MPLIISLDFARQSERKSRKEKIYLRKSKYQAKDEYLILLIEVSFVRYFFKLTIIIQSFLKFENIL